MLAFGTNTISLQSIYHTTGTCYFPLSGGYTQLCIISLQLNISYILNCVCPLTYSTVYAHLRTQLCMPTYNLQLRYVSLKMMHVCRNLSVAVLLFRYKRSSEDTNAAPKDTNTAPGDP